MRTSELIKLLRDNGCYLSRNGTRHDIWYSPKTGKKFEVARHAAEVPMGTVHKIMKEAGLK